MPRIDNNQNKAIIYPPPPSVIKNTSNAPNTDTLNTKQKVLLQFCIILYITLLRLNQEVTSKITHILKISVLIVSYEQGFKVLFLSYLFKTPLHCNLKSNPFLYDFYLVIIYYIFTLQSITNQAIQNYKLINTLIQIKITHNTKT